MEDNRENIESADEEKKDTEQTDGMKMIGNETDTSDCNDDPQEERNEQTLKDPEEKKEEAEPQKQTFKSEKKVKKCPSWHLQPVHPLAVHMLRSHSWKAE